MKVAICISGEYRNYKQGYLDLKNKLTTNHELDTYIHVWEPPDYILDLFRPTDYFFQKYIPFDLTGLENNIHNILSHYYSYYACNKLLNNSKVNYDAIISTNFNSSFPFIEINDLDLNSLNIINNTLVISSPKLMDIYSSCFSFIINYMYMDPGYDSQDILEYHLQKNNINPNYINV